MSSGKLESWLFGKWGPLESSLAKWIRDVLWPEGAFCCACGRITDLSSVLEARDRDAAGRTAPAEGLYLNRVFYREKERLEAQEEDFQ